MKIFFYSYKGGRGWSFWQLIRESLPYSSEQNIDHLIQDIILHPSGLDINVCLIPVKTDVGQVDLVLRLSDGTSENIRDSQTCRYDGQIYFHWYKILVLLYERALFDLQFVHNLFWLKLKWNVRSKLFYCIYRSSMLWWSSRTLTKLKSQSQKRLTIQLVEKFGNFLNIKIKYKYTGVYKMCIHVYVQS
jgi:hypothetical protein